MFWKQSARRPKGTLQRTAGRSKARTQLALEPLEDRRLFAANIVPIARNFSIETRNFTPTSGDVLDGCCTAGMHKVLRFDFLIHNIGNADLVIGSPAARPELFVFHQGHGHYHLKDFNEYELLNSTGGLVRPGFKQAFCVMDIEMRTPGSPPAQYSCGNQGLTRGWADVYSSGLSCQFIIIDGVADGVYQLRARTNVSRKVVEDDYVDNTTMVTVRIQGNTVTQLAPTDIGNTTGAAWNTDVGIKLNNTTYTSQIGAPPWGASADVDMFRFEGLQGTTVTVTTNLPSGGRAMDTMLRVFNAAGTQIAANDDCNPPANRYSCINNFAIPSTGVYYVGVSGYSNGSYNATTGAGAVNGSVGDYTLRLALSSPPDVGETMTTALATGIGPGAGSAFERSREFIGWSHHGLWDVDIYRISANAGTTLMARTSQAAGEGQMDTMIRLFDATGNPLAINDDDVYRDPDTYWSMLNHTFTASGTYFVGVSGFNNQTYSPRYAGSGDAANISRPVRGIGAYKLNLALMAQPDIGDTLATARVTPLGPGVGSFVLPWEHLGNGSNSRRDVDIYRFTANAGTVLSARTLNPGGQAMDTILRVFNSSGVEVIRNDDNDGTAYSRLDYTIPTTGTYYAGVSGYSNFGYNPNTAASGIAGRVGDYRLELALASQPDIGETLATAINTGVGPIGGNYTVPYEVLGNGVWGPRDVDMYRFTADAGFRVTATTALPAGGRGMDTYLRLFNSAGTQLTANDDCGSLYSCINNFAILTGGTYYLGVSGYTNTAYNPNNPGSGTPGSMGDYRFTLSLAAVPTTSFTVVPSAGSVTAGVPVSLTVTARDSGGAVNPTYRGAVAFTSTDGAATLPTNYTFTTADAGVHTFTGVILRTAGARSITARDTVNGAILGTGNVTVNAAAASTLALTGLPGSVTAGATNTVTVTLRDAFNNLATGYTGTVAFTSTDGAATLPINYTFTSADAGTHTFTDEVILRTAGGRSVTARDTVNGTLTSTANTTVNAADADHYTVTAPATVTAGAPFNLTVRVLDAFNNTVTGYNGTVTFASTDPSGGTMPADYTFQPGDAGVHTFVGETALYIAGTHTIYAVDTVTGVWGSADVTVNPDVAVYFYLEAPAAVISGVPFNITAYALDLYGNIDVNYAGTVTFASTDFDPGVVLPPDYTFVAADAGVRTFNGLILVTLDLQTLYIADTVSGIWGSADIQVDPASAPGGGGSGGGMAPRPAVTPAGPATVADVRPVSEDQEHGRGRSRLDGVAVEWLFSTHNRREAGELFAVLPS